MNPKKLLLALNFIPKENTTNVFIKKYDNYFLEVDVDNNLIHWGEKIFIGENNSQNITKPEDFVVLECVDALLAKGYKAEDIVLEKVFPSGHGHSGRLDVFVTKDEKAFLMIECKTWGTEFEKEYKNLARNGGQLLTYFQNDTNAEFLVLYASRLDEKTNEIERRNEIVVIEESYRETANVKDLFERWNKFTKDNGVFDEWATAYNFESRDLQMKDLKAIKQEDSSFIFNRFLEILRHNAVSDKGNAFTKIFTLFLCKVKDEDRNENEELDFQWKVGKDTPIEFQKRLSDLYRSAMKDFLDKEVTDFSDKEFEDKYGTLNETVKKSLKEEFTRIRLEKNNEFAIKDVFDRETFLENNTVLKEVVELLQKYKFRYNKKQPFLGEFFELLLTTGLKQESGQFFTPVPIARFICKSVPLKTAIEQKLIAGARDELLPNVIDYAAGSGHFLTEAMEEMQNIIEQLKTEEFSPKTNKQIAAWESNPFDWAFDYIYGIERDYRLVRTTKVGCYLHGDGVAKVIHGDGLDSFAVSKKYKGKLKIENNQTQDNGNFDFVLSNPPYSVSSFKGNTQNDTFEKDFELYKNLTDQSSEIESLFIERTKQLLKEDGVTALVLPASILNNTGIYTKTREILLKYFQWIAIAELGSNTFMATGTSTVTLFLRRRNNYFWTKTAEMVAGFMTDQKDKTINGVENIFSKYVAHVWEDGQINFADYQSLIAGYPNENIQKSEFWAEYHKKIKEKTDAKKLAKIREIEQEKLLYFALTYSSEIVLVNSGQKKAEKQFLGYEFSNRRGDEGLHAIHRGKSVDECTSLYDETEFYNAEKASTYILEAFEGKKSREISENLQKNISRVNLVDMIAFDRTEFEKTISTSVKKKIKIESQWDQVKLRDVKNITEFINGYAFKSIDLKDNKTNQTEVSVLKIGNILKDKNIVSLEKCQYHELQNFGSKISEAGYIVIALTGATVGKAGKVFKKSLLNQRVIALRGDEQTIKYVSNFLFGETFYEYAQAIAHGNAQGNLSPDQVKDFKIPLPPKDIQQKIVDECETVDQAVNVAEKLIADGKDEIEQKFENLVALSEKTIRLSDSNVFDVCIGKRVLKSEIKEKGLLPVYSANVFEPFGYINKELLTDFSQNSVTWGIDGDWMVNVMSKNKPFYPTDHCGYLRLKKPILEEKYIAYVLHKKGLEENFSRVKRASIEKIKGIKIPLPPLETQQKIVAEIEVIEKNIARNQSVIDESRNKKDEILRKYL